MKNLLLILLVPLVLSRCEPVPKKYAIWIKNNSFADIQFHISEVYPDTTLPANKPVLIVVESGIEYPRDKSRPWKEFIENLPSDTLSVFIFDSDTIKSVNWDDIQKEYSVLKRYDLSIENLEMLDWTITYPPTKEMEGVKAFP